MDKRTELVYNINIYAFARSDPKSGLFGTIESKAVRSSERLYKRLTGKHMKAENKEQRSFTLRNYETDFLRRVKPSAVLGFFQETAGDHSEKMGMGYADLAAEGCFWVLSKIYVECERRPICGETLLVETWPHEPNKAIYERSFRVSDRDGVAMRAYSRWCILRKNGRIVPCSAITHPSIEYIAEKSVAFDDWRIPEITDREEPAFTIRVANSEYDFNYHVNNIKYADYIFNCFSVKELEEKVLHGFQIHYIKQSHEGDVLNFYRKEISENEYVVEGVKNGTETVVAARVYFR